jgi:protein TonB
VIAVKKVGPARISSGVVSGLKLSGPTPQYPAIAKAAHVGGSVVLHAIISKTGSIESLQAVSGPDMLKGAAMDAVKQWRYKPYLLNGEPTEVDTTITVNFNLNGG